MGRTEELKEHLKGRGYRDAIVDTQIQLATQTSLEEALLPRPQRQALERIPLVVTYHPGLTGALSPGVGGVWCFYLCSN